MGSSETLMCEGKVGGVYVLVCLGVISAMEYWALNGVITEGKMLTENLSRYRAMRSTI